MKGTIKKLWEGLKGWLKRQVTETNWTRLFYIWGIAYGAWLLWHSQSLIWFEDNFIAGWAYIIAFIWFALYMWYYTMNQDLMKRMWGLIDMYRDTVKDTHEGYKKLISEILKEKNAEIEELQKQLKEKN